MGKASAESSSSPPRQQREAIHNAAIGANPSLNDIVTMRLPLSNDGKPVPVEQWLSRAPPRLRHALLQLRLPSDTQLKTAGDDAGW